MKRACAAIALLLVLAASAFAAPQQADFLMGGLVDGSGNLLSGGKVYTYEAGTSTPKTTWKDAGKAQAHPNPIILDAFGSIVAFADGSYKFAIYDANDVLVDTRDGFYYDATPNMEDELGAENAGIVDIGVANTVATINLGNVKAGDRVFVSAQIASPTKGATAGWTRFYVWESGTAGGEFFNSSNQLYQGQYQQATSNYCTLSASGIFKVTSDGTLIFNLVASSFGSNATLSAGKGQLYAYFLKKQ